MNPSSDMTPERIAGRMDRLPFLPMHLRITSLLGIGTLFDGFDSLSIAGALTMIIATFHIDYKSAGALGSAAFLGQIVGALAFGWLSERIGRKWAFISSLFIFGACSLFAATASNEHELLWARAIQGIGLGAEVPIAAALFNEYARSAVRGKWVMLYETMFIYGLVLAPFAGLVLYSSFGPELGWRVLFGIGGIPALVAILAIFALPESPRWLASKGRLAEADAIVSSMEDEARKRNLPLPAPVDVPPVVKESTSFIELFQGRYAKRTFVVWTQWFCSYFVSNGFQIWQPLLLMKIGGLPTSAALALSVVSSVLQVLFAYATAGFIDRVGRVPWFAWGFGLSALFALGGALAGGVYHVHGWQVLVIFGFGMTSTMSVNNLGVYLFTPEQYPTRMRAWGTAAGSSLNRLASFIAPLAIGALLTTGSEALTAIFVMFALVALFGAIVMATMGEETKLRTLEELSP
jgi:putative MFS transporter